MGINTLIVLVLECKKECFKNLSCKANVKRREHIDYLLITKCVH